MKRIEPKVEAKIIRFYQQGKSTQEIINKFNISNTTLYGILNRNKINKRLIQGLRIKKKCVKCDKEFERIPYEINIQKYCSKKCADDYRRGKSLKEFMGPEKAYNVTETARRRAKTNPNLKKFKKGDTPWNKAWDKGSYFSPEATNNIRKGQLKVAKMRKGKSPEEWYGEEVAKKWRIKQSKAKETLWTGDEYRRRMVEAHIGQEAWNKGTTWEDIYDEKKVIELRKKNRVHILRQYASGKFPKQSNTSIEIKFKAELAKRGYIEKKDFVHQFLLHNKFLCDFVFPNQKLVIECDGDYWHVNPKRRNPKPLTQYQKKDLSQDKAKNAYIKRIDKGSWKLIRFWETDINKDVSQCVDKVEKILQKRKY